MRAAMDMIIMLSTLARLWLLTILDPLHSLVLFRWDPKVTALFAPVAPSMCSNLKTWYHSKDGVGIQRKSSQTLMFVAYSASNWSHSFLSIGIAITIWAKPLHEEGAGSVCCNVVSMCSALKIREITFQLKRFLLNRKDLLSFSAKQISAVILWDLAPKHLQVPLLLVEILSAPGRIEVQLVHHLQSCRKTKSGIGRAIEICIHLSQILSSMP